MTYLDPERQCIVLRVVYDGPALAGKTTNLNALAKLFGVEIFSGEEADGRTLYFDWVDYIGGSFEGLPIRCQIVSVPGQQILQSRRRWHLDQADAVVFVADSRPEQMAENRRSFALLRDVLAAKEPPVGMIVQANKRDVGNAVGLGSLRSSLDEDGPLVMTEAVAEAGEGVRETFVLAVRLGLDRVRALQQRDSLPVHGPEIEDGAQLMAAVLAAEQSQQGQGGLPKHVGAAGGSVLTALLQGEKDVPPPAKGSHQAPPLPDATVPPDLVWPPVRGRIAIYEATQEACEVSCDPAGDWVGESDHWKLHAPSRGRFEDLDAGRIAFLDWVRWHEFAGRRLSSPRSLALVPEPGGTWQLWQVVGRKPGFDFAVHHLIAGNDDAQLAEGLFRLMDQCLQAEESLITEGWLDLLDAEAFGSSEDFGAQYIGLAPYPTVIPEPGNPASRKNRILQRAFGLLLSRQLEHMPGRIPAVLGSLEQAASTPGRSELVDLLQETLLGS